MAVPSVVVRKVVVWGGAARSEKKAGEVGVGCGREWMGGAGGRRCGRGGGAWRCKKGSGARREGRAVHLSGDTECSYHTPSPLETMPK